jgi:hypothetical protein
MEVHHHPEVEKKGFKEYLLEGLMIFLAVTMGFFAESLRENMTRKDKETEYITSLVRDLEKDKITLNEIIKYNQNQAKDLNSLLAFANADMGDAKNRKQVYYYARSVASLSVFISNDATMSQLKSAGGLQFIKRGSIADSIAKYDQEMRGINAAERPYTKFIDEATDAMSEIFFFTLKNDGKEQGYPLTNYSKEKIQVFFNKVELERGWTENYIKNLQQRVPFNARLIRLLRDEYDVK